MKAFLFCLSALVVAATAASLDDLKEVKIEELLADEARRKGIFDCLMDQAPCGEYQIYRDVLPPVIETQCEKCTPEQKAKFEETTKYLLEHHPNEFNAVMQKYGPKQQKSEAPPAPSAPAQIAQ